jgi:hypothetical protein
MAQSNERGELVPGLGFAESIEWQVALLRAGFGGVSVCPLRGSAGRFGILVDAEPTSSHQILFSTVGECRNACESYFFLPIRSYSSGQSYFYGVR